MRETYLTTNFKENQPNQFGSPVFALVSASAATESSELYVWEQLVIGEEDGGFCEVRCSRSAKS